MIANYLWKTGSAVMLISGVMHIHGTLYTTDLYPKDKAFIELMKSQTLEMSDKLNVWNPWLGFNACFGVGFLAIGLIHFYLAFKHFQFLQRSQFLKLSIVILSGAFAWFANTYFIPGVMLVFLFIFLCFLLAYVQMGISSLKEPA